MKLARRNVGLAVLLAALVAVDFALRRPRAGVTSGEPVLAQLDPTAVTTIHIEHGGEVLDLERKGAGWRVAQRYGFPAYGARIDELLQRLVLLRSDSVVSSEQDSAALFGLDDPARLDLVAADGRRLAELELGEPRDGASGSYVRIRGEREVYRAAGLDAIDPRPMLWVDAHVLDLEIPSVQVVAAEFADGTSFELIKTESGRWVAAGGTGDLPAARVDPLLLVADTLYFEDVQGSDPDESGLDAPALRLRFTLGEGRLIRFDLGGVVGATRAATRPDWEIPWVVRIPSSSAARLEAVARDVADALR